MTLMVVFRWVWSGLVDVGFVGDVIQPVSVAFVYSFMFMFVFGKMCLKNVG